MVEGSYGEGRPVDVVGAGGPRRQPLSPILCSGGSRISGLVDLLGESGTAWWQSDVRGSIVAPLRGWWDHSAQYAKRFGTSAK